MVVPEEATDEALASRAALGDDQAFDEITIRYQARVYRLACRLQATPRILRDATAAAMPPELQRSLLAFLRAQRADGPQQKD